MSKKRTKWLRKNILPEFQSNTLVSKAKLFRSVKKWWKNLPVPAKQAVANEYKARSK